MSLETALVALVCAIIVTVLIVLGATTSVGSVVGVVGLLILGLVVAALSPFAALGGSIYGIYAAVEAGKKKTTTTQTPVALPDDMGLVYGWRS